MCVCVCVSVNVYNARMGILMADCESMRARKLNMSVILGKQFICKFRWKDKEKYKSFAFSYLLFSKTFDSSLSFRPFFDVILKILQCPLLYYSSYHGFIHTNNSWFNILK